MCNGALSTVEKSQNSGVLAFLGAIGLTLWHFGLSECNRVKQGSGYGVLAFLNAIGLNRVNAMEFWPF